MNKKIWTITLAVILTGSFFLPYLNFFGASVSGYDLVFGILTNGMPAWKYILLITPFCGILLLIGNLGTGKFPMGKQLLAWLSLLSLIAFAVILYLYFSDGSGNMDSEDGGGPVPIGGLLKILGYGYWIAFVASLSLIVYSPKEK